MSNKIRISAALALGLVSAAAAPASAATTPLYGPVQMIVLGYDNNVNNTYFAVADTTDVTGCAKDGAYTMALIPDTDRGKQMFSLVQAALLSGRSLHVELDPALGGPYCWAKRVYYSR